jgi:hypothetical protein
MVAAGVDVVIGTVCDGAWACFCCVDATAPGVIDTDPAASAATDNGRSHPAFSV